MNTDKINCLNIAYIFKTSLGSINGSWTEGNVSTVKKITLPNGSQIPYISGQSLKYQIRQGLLALDLKDGFAPSYASSKSSSVSITAGLPAQYIDDDLFGYLNPKGDYKDANNAPFKVADTYRRTSPIRTSAAIGIFPFRNDRDLGTKSKEKEESSSEAGGNIFETEIYYNYFRVNILIELDRIGIYQPFELPTKKAESLKIEQRRERLIYFLNALSHIWGGGKQSRLLTDMSPKFLAITFQTAKSPIFLETLTVNDNEELHTGAIQEVLESNKAIIKHQVLGLQSGIFKNADTNIPAGVTTIQNAFNSAVTYINDLNF